MHIIGITGGIGAGKSAVIEYLKEYYQANVVKADDVGHLGMRKGGECYLDIIDLLGSGIIDDDGELNRSKIAAIVHNDVKKLAKLDAIIHPFVKRYIITMMEDACIQDEKYFFIEAALFFEDNYDQICDEVWYVYATPEVRCARLAKSRNYSDAQSKQIMSNQLSDDEFRDKCDFVIDNSGEFTKTIKQINLRMQKYETM